MTLSDLLGRVEGAGDLNALAPCRKCGVRDNDLSAERGRYVVECYNCDHKTTDHPSAAAAYAEWNARALIQLETQGTE